MTNTFLAAINAILCVINVKNGHPWLAAWCGFIVGVFLTKEIVEQWQRRTCP